MGFVYDAPAGLGCFVYMINRWFAPPANVPTSLWDGKRSVRDGTTPFPRARRVVALKVYVCFPAKTVGKLSRLIESRLAADAR